MGRRRIGNPMWEKENHQRHGRKTRRAHSEVTKRELMVRTGGGESEPKSRRTYMSGMGWMGNPGKNRL